MSKVQSLILGTLAPVVLLATAARAADVSLDDVAIKAKDANHSAVIKHLDVKGSSLSAEDLRKLFSGDLPPADEKALAAKFTAASVSAPEIAVKSPEGTLTVHNLTAAPINAGRVGKSDVAGADFVGVKPGVGGHIGALHLEGADISHMVDAADGGKTGYAGVTSFTLEGADFQTPDNEGKGKADPAALVHVVVAPVTFVGTYDGQFPVKMDFSAKSVAVTFPPGSDAGTRLKAFGYDKVEIAVASSGTCDKTAKSCNGKFALTWPNGAALTFSGDVGNVPADFSGGGSPGLTQTLQAFQVNLVNSGLIDKLLDAAAKQRGTNTAGLKAQLTQMTVMVPMMLGDMETGKKISDAVNAFLAQPKSLTVGVKAKGAAPSFAEMAQFRKPADALARFTLDAKANQ